jgi:type I restriction enzyme S subunit
MSIRLIRGRFLFREVNERGFELPLGSVTQDGGVEFRSDLTISVWNPADDVSGYKRVRPDDFVIGLRSFQSGIGHSQVEALVSPAYTVLRPISEKVHPLFFKHLFKSSRYIAQLENVAQGIRQGRTIAAADFYNIECPVPELAKQRAIADYLDTETTRIDALIAKKQRLSQLTYERWRTHLVTTLGPHLSSGSVPDGWRKGRLKNLVDSIVNGSWGSEPGTSSINAQCVRAADFDFRRLAASTGAPRSYDASDYSSRRIAPGELVLEKSGGGDETPVGRVVMWEGDGPAIPTNFAARMRPLPEHDPWFVLLAFRAAYEAGLNWKALKQTTGIQNLDSLAFLGERWPIPPLADQSGLSQTIRRGLAQVVTVNDATNQQVELLRERRQALVTAAVTGDLKIPGVAA